MLFLQCFSNECNVKLYEVPSKSDNVKRDNVRTVYVHGNSHEKLKEL